MDETISNRRIIIPLWGLFKSGGTRVLSQIGSGLFARHYNVMFIVCDDDSDPYYPIKAPIIYVDYKGNTSNNRNSKSIKPAVRLKALIAAVNNMASTNDIILANYYATSFVAYLSKVKNQFYYIQAYEAWYHGNGLRDVFFNTCVKLSYELPLVKIVNADIYKHYKNIRAKYVIPPGLDLKNYYPKENNWDGKRPFVIGCIGRKEEWKGSGDVAKAVEILLMEKANIHFKVAFNEVDCSNYELVHPDGDNNLADYYRSVDVLVAPGTIQLGAIHYPVIEAMACNTFVITTGYYPANEENSYIVPVHSPEKIADSIKYIMNNYQEALDKASKAQEVIQQFDWDNIVDSFIDVFEKEIRK